MITLEAITGFIGTACLGSFAWVFQLGNRVTKVETKVEDLPTLINSQFEALDQRLERIERAMNGSLHRY